MKTTIIGYPRIGSLRELKFATEKYFKGVNPDCGLKTRGNAETVPNLENLVNVAQEIRRSLQP